MRVTPVFIGMHPFVGSVRISMVVRNVRGNVKESNIYFNNIVSMGIRTHRTAIRTSLREGRFASLLSRVENFHSHNIGVLV